MVIHKELLDESPADRLYSDSCKLIPIPEFSRPDLAIGTLNKVLQTQATLIRDEGWSRYDVAKRAADLVGTILKTAYKNKVVNSKQLTSSEWKYWRYFISFLRNEFVANDDKHVATDTVSKEDAGDQFLTQAARAQCITALIHLHNWDTLARPTYYVTSDLALMLTHTNIMNVPSSLIKVPYDSITICPLGNYVSKLSDLKKFIPARHYKQDADVIMLISTCTNIPDDVVEIWLGLQERGKTEWVLRGSIDLREGETIGEILDGNAFNTSTIVGIATTNISKLCKTVDDTRLVSKTLAQYVLSILLYLSVPDADIVLGKDSPEYHAWAKAMSRKKKTMKRRNNRRCKLRMETQRRFIVGSSFRIIDRHGAEEGLPGGEEVEKRFSPTMHWRRGHFKAVVFGEGRKGRRTQWIQPTIVGHRGTLERTKYKAR